MLNPWLILGFVLALAAAGIGGEIHGHKWGVDQQAKADQAQFDRVNADIASNKAQAAALLNEANAKVIQTLTERDALKTRLEAQNAVNRKQTDDLASQLRGMQLRFAAQDSGSGASGDGAASTVADAANHDAPATCVLSEEASRSIEEIVLDADRLRDDYRLLYDWAHSLR